MDDNVVISKARKFLKDAGVNSVPVDVDALALSLGFQVSRQELPDGEAGTTFERRGKKHIWVNQKDGLPRQRFTILHEIAHHVLQLPSKHGEKLPSHELERFKGRPKEEAFCDLFAAECLVPFQYIQPLTGQDNFTDAHLRLLTSQFQASRSCVASSYVLASKEHVAFVVAEEGIVQYAITSPALRALNIRIDKGRKLPRDSAAASAIRANESRLFKSEIESIHWSNSDEAQRFVCFEEATYYAPKAQTQSLLSFEEVHAQRATNNYRKSFSDEDDLLEELSGYPGWSSPR